MLFLLAAVIALVAKFKPEPPAVIKPGAPGVPPRVAFSAPLATTGALAPAVVVMETARAGILWPPAPAPVNAAPLTGTQAQTVTEVRPGLRTQAVVITEGTFPGLAAVLGSKLKSTMFPLVTLTESDSDIVALRVTVPTFEIRACAAAGFGETISPIISKRPAIRMGSLPVRGPFRQ